MSLIWQNFQTSRVELIPNYTNNIVQFVYYWHDKITHLILKRLKRFFWRTILNTTFKLKFGAFVR